MLVLFLSTALPCAAQKGEKSAIVKVYEKYKSAILNDKGDHAVSHVDSRTIKYYSDMLELVKTADSAAVDSLSLMDKLMVFSIRHRTSKEEIRSFDGKALLSYAVASGMVGKNSVSNNTIGEVTVNENFAKGQMLVHGKPVPVYMHFYKEEGIWKIDLTSLFPVVSLAFRKMQEESGQTENEYLFQLLEMLTGRHPGNEIWMPTR